MAGVSFPSQIYSITKNYLPTVSGLNNLLIKTALHSLDFWTATGRSLSPHAQKIHGDVRVFRNFLCVAELAEQSLGALEKTYELFTSSDPLKVRLWNVFSSYVNVSSPAFEVLEVIKAREWVQLDSKTNDKLAVFETFVTLFVGFEYLIKDLLKDRSVLGQDEKRVDNAIRYPLLALYSAVVGFGVLGALSLHFKDRFKVTPLIYPLLSTTIQLSVIATHYGAALANVKSKT
jgi:hypothetical protein